MVGSGGRRAARLARGAFALVALAGLSSCYLWQAARGQHDLVARRRPIAAVLADPATPGAVRDPLALVVRLRDYASASLALPDNQSYRGYVDLGRRYVVWNVFAAPEFSVEPLTWCFPVAGCVPYRGYFHEPDARDYGLGLETRGNDVLVAGVPAYSTLGHFADPVLRSMLGWSEADLAGLLFHELAHQVAYAKGDSTFNEGFATVVEREGVRRWFADGHAPAAFDAYRARERERAEVAALLAAARTRLSARYASMPPGPALREAKRAEFDRLRADYAGLRGAGRVGPGYDWLFGPSLGNASLLAVATYEDCVPALEAMLHEEGDDLAAFYRRLRELARASGAERRRTLGGYASGTCR